MGAQSIETMLQPAASKGRALRYCLLSTVFSLIAPAAYAQSSTPPKAATAPDSTTVDQLVVTATRFNTTSVTSVNKIAEQVIDTSQSVKVLSADELSFAGVNTLSDLGKLDSGEYTTPIGSGYVIQNYFRGFGGVNTCGDFPVKVDGFRSNCEMPADLAAYGSVDVLKGSSSSVYGQSFVAGTLVLNSKQPLKDFGGSASVEAGQFEHGVEQLDMHGSFNKDQTIYGRLIVSNTSEGASFSNFRRNYLTFAPSVRWDITPNDSVTWLLNTTHVDSGAGFGFPLAFNAAGPGGVANGANYSVPDIPLKQLGFLEPPWAKQTGQWLDTSIRYQHDFENNWHLSIAGQHNEADYDNRYLYVGAYSTISPVKTQKTNVYLYFERERDHQWAGEINLFGDVEAFGHKQTFFFGGDYTDALLGIRPFIGGFEGGGATGFNVYQGNWSALPSLGSVSAFLPGGPYSPPGFAVAYNRDEVNSGFEFGALLRPIDDLTINLGARWSNDTETLQRVCCSLPLTSLDGAPKTDARPGQSQWTYQVGANYAFRPGIHAYFSYGTTFEAANKFGFNPLDPTGIGNFLGPQKGSSTEIGVKGESASKLVNWSFDVFDTEITNSFQPDPNHLQYSISTGAERATGFEAEWQGKIMPAWDVTASASSTRNVYTAGPFNGLQSPFAVPFGVSVFTQYKILGGPLEGLGFGGGYIYKSRAPYKLNNGADLSNLIKDDEELDLRLFYEVKQWRFDLFANNVTSNRYVAPRLTNTPQFDWYVNQPAQVYAKISVKF